MAQDGIDFFVLVHYFGRAADITNARLFCQQWNALLIEDAVHVLRPSEGIGALSDFVFFSPHKTLAVPDGAVLFARDDTLAKSLTADIKTYLSGSVRSSSSTNFWIAKRVIQRCLPSALMSAWLRQRLPDFGTDPPSHPIPEPEMSTLARRLLVRASSELEVIAASRRDNWYALLSAWEKLKAPIQPLWTTLTPAEVPYRYILRCVDSPTAAHLYDRLRKIGFPVHSWPDLPPEVAAAPDKHSVAVRLRQTLIFMPVHDKIDTATVVRKCAGLGG
jgi:dTDP-4-amino-4,6-dideoxygalactose transaminase